MNAQEDAKNGSPLRILVVDDNSDAAHTTGMWLKLTGHEVDVLTDGAKCLPHLELFSPDVLLLDIAMPNISGYELAKKIRSEPRFKQLAIIAISGFADPDHARRSLASGCSQHLVKPVDLQHLNDVIAQEVQKNRI